MLKALANRIAPMASPDSQIQRIIQPVKSYLAAPVGDYYAVGLNRMMIYPFLGLVLLLECLTHWAIRYNFGFMLDHLAFTTVYSLHKATLFTLCMWVADLMAYQFLPKWGRYTERTVGRQWAIWALGVVLGILLLKGVVNRLVIYYAPEIYNYFLNNPDAKISPLKALLLFLPYWIVAVFLTLQVARAKNQTYNTALSQTGLESQANQDFVRRAIKSGMLPSGTLDLGKENGQRCLNLADVTHVTVEDHYCRVHYAKGPGLQSVLMRIPLKELRSILPEKHFLQTHRSHLVNLGHVSRLSKTGREHKVVLQHFKVELPVSRHRFKQLEPYLKAALRTN